jgi:branched-chain amino acid aminotransferase
MILWLNGTLQPGTAARIDPADRGFTLGDGVFETIRAEAGEPTHLSRHLERLRSGLELLGLSNPYEDAALADALRAVLSANRLTESVLRLTVSRGIAARGVWPEGPVAPTVLITLSPLPKPQPPARLIVAHSTRRNEFSPLSGIKSLNYLDSILARREAADQGADDALLLNTQGFVAEATAANLFLIRGGRLLTPAAHHGALPGITRARLLENGAEEAEIRPEDCAAAQAVFLSNSLGLREVVALSGEPLAAQPDHIADLARELGFLRT